jgi:acetyl esterase/lipase
VPLEDCYAAFRWLAARPEILPARIAVGGASAGGNLAAALTLLARDRGAIRPAFQLLTYPMLDDRTDGGAPWLRVWTAASNRFGWRCYLGGGAASPLAAPARHESLAGLPPAWIGVGTADLFHDENVRYASRLRAAGVACELHEIPGAYHAFDYAEPWAPVSRAFRRARQLALRQAL